jgi:DNA polymerase-3 subunit beta
VLTATNLELMISAKVDSKVEALLPPKIIEIAEAVGDFEMELHGQMLHITAGRGQFNLPTDSGFEDYPAPFHATELFEVEPKGFIEAAASVVFAVSTEDSRPAFNGVLIESDGHKVTFTASDTYRLASAGVKMTAPEFRVLVKPTILKELVRLKPTKLSMGFTDSTVTFSFDDTLFTARLLGEKYPDVAGIIPKEAKTTISAVAGGLSQPLLDAVRRASLLADGKNKAIGFAVTENELVISATGGEGNMEEKLPVNKTGDDLSLLLNANYLQDILKYEGIEIHLHGEGGAVVIKRPGYDYTYLLLPIKKMG